MARLTDEEIDNMWEDGMSFKELVQEAFEHGYKLGYNYAHNKPSKNISMLEKIIKRTEKSYGR